MTFERLMSTRRRRRPAPRPGGRRARPSAERLEGRALLTISIEPRPAFVTYIGKPERLVAATFTDSDRALTAGDFAATIDWGDGTTSAGEIAEGGDGTFSVSALKTYAKPGTYPIGQGAYPITVTVSSPVNGDAASTAEMDAPQLDSPGDGAVAGTSRGVVTGLEGHYVANPAAGAVVDYDILGGASLITVPGPGGGTSSPTGVALLPGATDELVIVTSGGTIAVWTNPGGLGAPPDGQAATTVLDHSASGADFEGVTTGTIPTAGGGTESVIFVADFADGKVEAYDAGTFAPVDLGSGSFSDPSLPAGYAPFNVQEIGGTVYVAYAETSGTKGRAVDGAGKGYLDSFDPSGHLLARFNTGGGLDAPMGIALAPANMGVYAGSLLVANTGDGTISVFDPAAPAAPRIDPGLPGVLGRVAGPGGGPLTVDGLWGLSVATFHSGDITDTYLDNSSGVGEVQFGSFSFNPTTLANVVPEPATGIANAPTVLVEFLGDPSHTLTFGQFIDPNGAVDGSDAGELSVSIDWGNGSAPTAGTLAFESDADLAVGAKYIIRGTAPYTATGSHTVTVTVAMAGGASYTAQVPVTVVAGTSPVIVPITPIVVPVVATAPTISMSPQVTATAAASTPFRLGTFGGPTATYTVAVDWGDGSAPSFGQAVPGAAGTSGYTLTGTHTYNVAGTYAVTVNLLGPGGLSEWVATKAVVAPSAGAPKDVTPVAVAGYKGIALTGELAGFIGSTVSAVGYRAAIDWGDGTAPVFGTIGGLATPQVLPGGPQGPFPDHGAFGTHTYAATGTYKITVAILAPDGSSTWTSTTATIAATPTGPVGFVPALPATAVQSVPTTGITLAEFAAAPGSYTAAVDWGDGSSPTFAAIVPLGNIATNGSSTANLPGFDIKGSHTYALAGKYTATINLRGPGGVSEWAQDKVTVTPAGKVLDHPGGTQGRLVVAHLGTFQYQGYLPPASPVSALIDWADGSPLTSGTVTTGAPLTGSGVLAVTFNVAGSHTYLTPGVYIVGVELIVPDGETVTTTQDVIIGIDPTGPINLAPVAVKGARDVPLAAPLATFGLPIGNTDSYVAAINWGDGSAPTSGAVQSLPSGSIVVSTVPNRAVTGSHTYVVAGSYTIWVDLIRTNGESDWVSTTATIAANPDAPTDLSPVAASGTQGVPLSGVELAQFNVPDPAAYKAAIDWGDGSGSFGTVTRFLQVADIIFPGQAFDGAMGTHTYALPGTYKVTIDLIGPDGESVFVRSSATIAPAAPAASGRLAAADAAAPGLTYNNRPTYQGTAPAGTVVGLYVRPSGGSGAPTLVGSAKAGVDGSWSITSIPLLSGSYDVAALDTNPFSGASAPAWLGTLVVAPNPARLAALVAARRIANASRFG